MFGFARSRPALLAAEERFDLRRFYCGLCDALRRDYGPPYAALTGWDGRFIALLTGAQLHEDTSAWTRCPALLGVRSRSMVPYGISTRYAAAVTVFLLGEKLDDDLQDERSKRARLAKLLTRRQVARAASMLGELAFPLAEAVSLRQGQRAVEASRRAHSLDEVTGPAAQATALILGHTAVLAGTPHNIPVLHDLGRAVGRIVTLLDACHDFANDTASDGFNAVAATAADREQVQSIPLAHFERTTDYLLEQLQVIRQAYTRLALRRHEAILQNILYMGLYDSMTDATTDLALCAAERALTGDREWQCPACGTPVHSRFCPSCGKGPRATTEGKEAK